MDELDLVDQVQFVEQHRADQAVEITARDEAVFFVGHVLLPENLLESWIVFQTCQDAMGDIKHRQMLRQTLAGE
jgi:hypothetical protein